MICTSPKLRADLDAQALEIVKRYHMRSVGRELAEPYCRLLDAWSRHDGRVRASTLRGWC
jgi:hypothetical protein